MSADRIELEPGSGGELRDVQTVSVAREEDEMEVDIMSFGVPATGQVEVIGPELQDEVQFGVGLTGVGVHHTITQLRQGSPRSTPPSPTPSPGPSALNNELTTLTFDNQQDHDLDPDHAYDPTRDPTPGSASTSRAPSRAPAGSLQPKDDRSQSPSASASPFPQPFAFAKTTLVPGRRTVLPKPAAFQAPVALYEALGDDDDDDDGHKVTKRKGKAKLKQAGMVEEQEEYDDRLYCICQSRYDANVDRAMIACDKCENWYHLDCVEIDEEKVHLVDQFICPICAKTSAERTTWKAPCARCHCLQAAVPLSKYCSDFCGAEVVAARLALSKVKQELFWDRVSGARRVEAAVIDAPNKRPKLGSEQLATSATSAATATAALPATATSGPSPTSPPNNQNDSLILTALNKELDDLTGKQSAVGLQIGMIESRMRYLRLAIRRWEKICADFVAASAAAVDESATAAKPKGKAKKPSGGPTAAPEAICGFDVRLVDSDEGWAEFVESEVGQYLLALEEPVEGDTGPVEVGPQESYEQVLCMALKKKCERHKGWQQVRDADFQVELISVEARSDRLTQLNVRLQAMIADLLAGVQFRALYQDRTGAEVKARVASPVQATSLKARARPNGINKGGRPTKLVQPPTHDQTNGVKIELPDEVLAGMTRTQQRQMLHLQGGR